MAPVYLMRHGQADYGQVENRGWCGAAFDLAPLTVEGAAQAVATARELHKVRARRVVSSPMTRALHTASLVAAETGLPCSVELDMREWLPDDTFSWRSVDDVLEAVREFEECGGEWPAGQVKPWEPFSAVRERTLAVLEKHIVDAPIIAVCHNMVIQALTGHEHTDPAGIRMVDLEPVNR